MPLEGVKMPPIESEIQRKIVPAVLVAVERRPLKGRSEIRPSIVQLAECIPPDRIIGPPICTFNFITEIEGAHDVEIGFPISEAFDAAGVTCRTQPEMEVLARSYKGPVEGLRDAYRELHAFAAERAIISDEFGREVYPGWRDPDDASVEIQFVRHRWEDLLARNVARVLGGDAAAELLAGREALSLATTAEERFRWVKGVMERLDARAGDDRMHEILTGCAHVFPDRHVERLRQVYLDAMKRTSDRLLAVDAVIAYRAANRPWGESADRQGNVVVVSKQPRDPDAHAKAQTAEEKRRAYCFCPIIRERLDEGMPRSFCYCGAGWERRQWEATVGGPVRVRVLHSVLRGDDACTFGIEIPEA
jgi:hypothetical protein